MAEIDSVYMIEELTGKKRKLELYGSGMPRKGASWGSTVTHSKTQNSGNADSATIHVLGPTDNPSAIAGKWSTTMLLRTPALFFDGGNTPQAIGRALTLAEVFEDFFRSGQRVRVTFVQTDSSKPRRIVREGIGADCSFNVDGADDIEWAANWEWAGRGVQKQKPDLAGDKTLVSLREANRVLTDYATEMAARDELQSVGGDVFPTSFGLADLEALANIPQEFAKQLSQFCTLVTGKISKYATLIVGAAATPITFASSMTQIATNAINVLNQTIDSMGCVMPDALSDLDGDAAALVNAADYFSVSQDGGERILGAMAQIRASAQVRQSGLVTATGSGEQALSAEILAVIITKQGDTYASLSLRYYFTADQGAAIASCNGYDESEISPPMGTTLVIPMLNPVLLPLKV